MAYFCENGDGICTLSESLAHRGGCRCDKAYNSFAGRSGFGTVFIGMSKTRLVNRRGEISDIKAVMHNVVTKGPIETIRLFKKRRADGETKRRAEELQRLADQETPAYRREVQARYIKEIIPAVYAEYSQKPIENKVVFMERGKAKSPSLNYIYRTLKEQGQYEVKLHVLKARAVPEEMYYENAVEYIKDAATAKAIFDMYGQRSHGIYSKAEAGNQIYTIVAWLRSV